MSSPAHHKDVLWYSREKDATWLAAQLRASRLTILQGQFGSGKTTLLRWGLLPRLRQRATDPGATPIEEPIEILIAKPKSKVVTFPDRRRTPRAGRPAHDPEAVVVLDRWDGRPLEALWQALHDSLELATPPMPESPRFLVESLNAWHRERGVRFLLVLDDFDQCLKASVHDDGARRFVDQWVQAVSDPRAAAHVLVGMSEPAEPLWWLLKEHLSSLGELNDHRLQLAGVSLVPPSKTPAPRRPMAAEPTPTPTPVQVPTPEQIRTPTPTPTPVPSAWPPRQFTSGMRQPAASPPSIATTAPAARPPSPVPRDVAPTALRTSDTGPDTELDLAQLSRSIHAAVGHALEAPPRTVQEPRAMPTPRTVSRRRARRTVSGWTIALSLGAALVLAGVVFVIWDDMAPMLKRAADNASSTIGLPPPAPPPTGSGSSSLPAPGFELVADAGDSSDDVLVSELSQLLTPAGYAAPTVRFPFGWSAGLASLAERPRLAMVSNDVLQAERRLGTSTSIQVVTPLFTQEIYFVVRSDSRLRYIHQIRSARLNTGPERGSRALVANGVFERLFGVRIPAGQANRASREEGLEHLLNDKSLDVVVLVGAQPDLWLSRLSAQRRRGLRLLELDPTTNATRRAMAAYPATRVGAERGSGIEPPNGASTLSLMTYLVAGNARTSAEDEQVRTAATALCRNLAALARAGHVKWREVKLGATVDTGWPNSSVARQVFSTCAAR